MPLLAEKILKTIHREWEDELKKTRKVKKGPVQPHIDTERLAECSVSELVTIAHYLGFENASRADTKEQLIGCILGEYVPPDRLRIIRLKTAEWLRLNPVMVSQLACSLKCATCPHSTVLDCYTDNKDLVDPNGEAIHE